MNKLTTANAYLEDGPGKGTLLSLPDLPVTVQVRINTERGEKLVEYRKTPGVRLGERLYKFSRFMPEDEPPPPPPPKPAKPTYSQ